MVRAYTSHPWTSYPNQAWADGVIRARTASHAVGSTCVKSCGTTAITSRTKINTRDDQKVTLCLSACQASAEALLDSTIDAVITEPGAAGVDSTSSSAGRASGSLIAD